MQDGAGPQSAGKVLALSRGARTLSAAACLVLFCQEKLLAADFVTEPVAEAVQLVNPAPAHASGLTVQGIFSETPSYDSNPLLLTSGAKPLYGSTTSPELILNSSTQSLQVNADTLVNANAFNQIAFNSVDLHSSASVRGEGELWSAGIAEKTDFDTTRTSELSNFDLTTRPFRHLGFEVDPEVSFNPDPIDKVSLAGSYALSQYQNTVFSDFDLYSIAPTYVHNFDPLNAGVFTVQAQHYNTTDNARNTTDTVGPSIGWISALTPEIAAKITFGAQTSRQTQAGTPSSGWDLQYIFSGDLTFKGERQTAEVVASRAEYPYGNGSEALLTSVLATETYRLNEVLAFNCGAGFESSEYQVDQTGNLQSEWTANLGFTYAVNDQMNVTTAYQFRYETLQNIAPRAEEHVLTVSLAYRLTPRPL